MIAPASGVIPVRSLIVRVSNSKPCCSAFLPVRPQVPYAKAALIFALAPFHLCFPLS